MSRARVRRKLARPHLVWRMEESKRDVWLAYKGAAANDRRDRMFVKHFGIRAQWSIRGQAPVKYSRCRVCGRNRHCAPLL